MPRNDGGRNDRDNEPLPVRKGLPFSILPRYNAYYCFSTVFLDLYHRMMEGFAR